MSRCYEIVKTSTTSNSHHDGDDTEKMVFVCEVTFGFVSNHFRARYFIVGELELNGSGRK